MSSLSHHPTTNRDLEELLELLDLHSLDDDHFLGHHPTKTPERTFGGQLMAQALIASGKTVSPTLPPVSLTIHFITGGDPSRDLQFQTHRLRTERRFANRRVDIYQDDQLRATVLVSYLAGGAGLEHSLVAPSCLPDPNHLARLQDHLVGYERIVPGFVNAPHPIEWRYINDPSWIMRDKGDHLEINQVWMKADGLLPEDPLIHTALLAYASDTTILDSIITRHGLSWGHDRIFAVTMNHSIWFHQPICFDQWVLYCTHSPAASNSCGLALGSFFTQEGHLMATTAQEGLLKYFPSPQAHSNITRTNKQPPPQSRH